MNAIGFNDDVVVSGRKFHVQTSSVSNNGTARCEVFEQGRIISKSEVEFERRRQFDDNLLEERISRLVENMHTETMNEIEMMFSIADKVKKLRHAPSNVKTGLMFLRSNLMKDAIEQFEIAISIDPDNVDAYNNLGLAYIRLGQNTKAIKILRKIQEKGRTYADISHNLGMAYLNEKEHYKALINFQEALRINPQYNEADYNIAILYLDSIIYDKNDNLLPPPSIRLERAHQQLNKLEQAKLKPFAQIAPKVQKLLKEGNLEEAIIKMHQYREKIFPMELLSIIGINFYLKFMYGGKGLGFDIIRKFERELYEALEEHPDYADLWNNLGVIHLIQCRNLFIQALNEFDRALDINPYFEKALKNKKLVENDGKEFLILLRAILK